jgi:YggT family protein
MNLVHSIISLYIWILIIAALLSWFPAQSSSGGLATTQRIFAVLTEPVLRPLRQILPRPRAGGVVIDFSVLVAVILLIFINRII